MGGPTPTISRRKRPKRKKWSRKRMALRRMQLDPAVGGAVDRSGLRPTDTFSDEQLRLRFRRPRRRMEKQMMSMQRSRSFLSRSSTMMLQSGRWTESGHVGVGETAASSDDERMQREILGIDGPTSRIGLPSPVPPRPCPSHT